MNFLTGITNLTSWMGNVIMPTLAGLFAAAAIFAFQQGTKLPALRLRSTGIPDVLWLTSGDGVVCQPVSMEQP